MRTMPTISHTIEVEESGGTGGETEGDKSKMSHYYFAEKRGVTVLTLIPPNFIDSRV